MKSREWSWYGASSVGTSHIASGGGCEDAAGCIEVIVGNRNYLVAAVSDGAGSAKFASLGSRMVVRKFLAAASSFLKRDQSLSSVNEIVAHEWIDNIRDSVYSLAERNSATPRDFAATLVGTIVGPDRLLTFHIGDGACAFRPCEAAAWEMLSWPAHGEYASSTYFVTDSPTPQLRLCHAESSTKEIILFSDGLKRLALDFSQQLPFAGFLDPIALPLKDNPPGRQRSLSIQIKSYLDSATITNRTDDDKTLLVARRVKS